MVKIVKLSLELLRENLEKRMAKDLEENNVGGGAVIVEYEGETVYRSFFGKVSPEGEAVTDKTLFRLASMTKPVTAAASLILIDRGLLSLEDAVDKFYPAFSVMKVGRGGKEYTDKKITVENLLTHTSGIGSGAVWLDTVEKLNSENIRDVESFIKLLSGEPLSFVPGTLQEYSGVGAFSVMTGIIQKLTDMPYEDFLKKEIFAPCCMENTTFVPDKDQWSRLIAMHDKTAAGYGVGKTYEGCVFEMFPAENFLGGAGLISSADDYLNFARMLLNKGVFGGKRILSESVRILSECAVKNMAAPHVSADIQPGSQRWGLGVRVITDESYGALPTGTFGWSGAYGTHFWIDPVRNVIGIYMKNSKYDGGAGAVTSANFEKDVNGAFV